MSISRLLQSVLVFCVSKLSQRAEFNQTVDKKRLPLEVQTRNSSVSACNPHKCFLDCGEIKISLKSLSFHLKLMLQMRILIYLCKTETRIPFLLF